LRDVHIVPWDAPGNYLRRALCGKYVTKKQTSKKEGDETCQACRDIEKKNEEYFESLKGP
jgi:hypothetical protein